MKLTAAVLLILSCTAAQSVELVMPDYRNESANRNILLGWVNQVNDQGIFVSGASGQPLDKLAKFIADNHHRNVVLEIPPVFYTDSLKAGWEPIARLERPGQMALIVQTGSDKQLSVVATPPRATLAHQVAQQLTQAELHTYPTHGDCLRAMVSNQADACVTAIQFANFYAERFGIQLAITGEPVTVKPSLMIAAQGVPDDVKDRLSALTITFPQFGAKYIPFVPERDLLLLVD